MRTTALMILALGTVTGRAQTNIEKAIPFRADQSLAMVFEYPELIRVKTWQKDYVLIKGEVSINMGENDSAFELKVEQTGPKITVTSVLRDEENIPKRLVIRMGDTEYLFKANDTNDPAVRKFFEEHGREYTYVSNGVSQKIQLEIFVPERVATYLEAKHGMVEVKDFRGPLIVSSRFGGIDASIIPGTVGQLKASTHFGEILTNLDLRFEQKEPGNHDNHTVVTARAGNGPDYTFESRFGKVYLRKSE